MDILYTFQVEVESTFNHFVGKFVNIHQIQNTHTLYPRNCQYLSQVPKEACIRISVAANKTMECPYEVSLSLCSNRQIGWMYLLLWTDL